MPRYLGVYPYQTKGGRKWRWTAEKDGAFGSRRGFDHAGDANDDRNRCLAEVAGGAAPGGRSRLFGDFLERDFLPHLRGRVAEGDLRESTARQYERDVRNHLLPVLGGRRLGDITVEDVERLGARDSDRLSPDTRRRSVLTLGRAFSLALRRRLIPFNPVTDAWKPSPRRRRPDLPTLDDLSRLAAAMRSPETRAFVLVAAFTGLRKSELFALRWEDVDLKPGAERVRVLRQWYKGKPAPPKTKASSREVILPPQAAEVLNELSVALQVDGRPNSLGLVFPSPMGRHWLDTNFDRRVWRPAREAAGLPGITVHTLRYFYVSHVRASGLPAAITEQLGGHVDERTHRGYSVPIPGTEALIRAGLDRAFGGGSGADA